MRPYGLTTAPKSDAYAVIDNGAPTRTAGRDHGRRRQWRRYQARRERARARRAIAEGA